MLAILDVRIILFCSLVSWFIVMSFVTYVLVAGLVMGTQNR